MKYRITIEVETNAVRSQVNQQAQNMANRHIEWCYAVGIDTKVVYIATDVVDLHVLDERR